MQTHSPSKLKQRKRKTRVKAFLWTLTVAILVIGGFLANRLMRKAVEMLAMQTTSWTCTEIQVIPGLELSADSILSLSACETNRPLASYSTEIVSERLLLNPWVKSVEVTRRPPGTLVIQVTERTGVAVIHGGSDLAVSDDFVFLPCENKQWKNSLPWLSCNSTFAREPGPMSATDPLFPVAREFVRVRELAPDVAENIAELYRVNGNWGAVLMNPVLSLTLSSDVPSENWQALNKLLLTSSFQDKLISNAVVDLRLPGFVTLQLPDIQAEDS